MNDKSIALAFIHYNYILKTKQEDVVGIAKDLNFNRDFFRIFPEHPLEKIVTADYAAIPTT